MLFIRSGPVEGGQMKKLLRLKTRRRVAGVKSGQDSLSSGKIERS